MNVAILLTLFLARICFVTIRRSAEAGAFYLLAALMALRKAMSIAFWLSGQRKPKSKNDQIRVFTVFWSLCCLLDERRGLDTSSVGTPRLMYCHPEARIDGYTICALKSCASVRAVNPSHGASGEPRGAFESGSGSFFSGNSHAIPFVVVDRSTE